MRGLAYAGQHGDSVFGTGTLDVARYGHVLKSRQLVGVRGAGEAFDGLYYVTSSPTLKRGEFKQSFSLARNGLLSTVPAVPMTDASSSAPSAHRTTASTAARSSTTSTRCRSGRIQAIVPGRLGPFPTSWAMPCLPVAGIKTGVFTVPQIGSGVWIEFEQGDPDYPIWVGGYWGTAAEVPACSRSAVPPAVNGFTIQTTLKNGIVVSDVPGPTGGILIQTTTGAMISVNDVGIVISNGKGAIINMVGPTVDVNVGALTVI